MSRRMDRESLATCAFAVVLLAVLFTAPALAGVVRELDDDSGYSYAIEVASYTIDEPAEPDDQPDDDPDDYPEEDPQD